MELTCQQISERQVRLLSKSASVRALLKMPLFLLLLPVGLLATSMSMIALSILMVALLSFYSVQSLFWRFSIEGRSQRLKEYYQRALQKVITREQNRRLKCSQLSDQANLQLLIELTYHEINKRKMHIDQIAIIEARRRLNRCADDMDMKNVLHIYNTLVDTELDSLNDALNQLFQ